MIYCIARFGLESMVRPLIIQLRVLPDRTHLTTVSDSLQHTPERATIVAMYKRLVIGCAILRSPADTYITYLAVRAGWENAQIATYAHHSLVSRSLTLDRFQCNAFSPHRSQSKQRYYSPCIYEQPSDGMAIFSR